MAWKSNFEKYLELKKSIPAGGDFQITGKMGMSIRIGFAEGVCLQSYHMPISTKSKLDSVISDYHYAKKKAEQMMKVFKSF